MSTQVQPAAQAQAAETHRRFAALSDDLALKIFVAVATTVVLGKLGFDPTTALLGAALSPVFAELVKSAVERKGVKRRHLLLATLFLFLVHGVERALAAARRRPRPPKRPVPGDISIARHLLLVIGAVASAVTVAALTAVEVAGGHSLVADRQLTFFAGGRPLPPDVAPPRLRLPRDLVIDASGPRRVWFAVSAVDVRDGAVEPDCSPRPGTRFSIGKTNVRCSAVDGAGNHSVGGFTVTLVQRDEHESIRMRYPERVHAEASGPDGAVARFAVTATGRDGRPLRPTCSPAPASLFAIGRTLVTCSARADGETVTRRFPVVIVDSTQPRLTLPGNLRLQTVEGGRHVDYRASAVDSVDGPLVPTCKPRSGFRFELGTTIVTCSTRDAHGNAAHSSFTVTVVRSFDTTPPRLRVPGDRVAEAASASGAVVTYKVTAGDDRDDAPSVTCMPGSGALFPIGVRRVDCTAADASGNRATRSFTVTISDTRRPVLTVPRDRSVEAVGPKGAPLTYSVSAQDAVDGRIHPWCSPNRDFVFPLGTTVVRCSARDRAGNAAVAHFAVSVQDTTGPVIVVSGTRVEATSPSGAPVAYRVSARDAVDGAVRQVTCSPRRGATFPLGDTTVRCLADDSRSNASVKSFAVTVVDSAGPKVYPPADVNSEARSARGAPVRFAMAKAVDAVDGAVRPTCSPLSGSTFPLGETIVTCSATDRRGNRGKATFRVTVGDTTAPTLQIGDQTRYISSGNGAYVRFPHAIDAVDGEIAPRCRPASGSFFAARKKTTVRCTATDRSGNSSPPVTFAVWVEYMPD